MISSKMVIFIFSREILVLCKRKERTLDFVRKVQSIKHTILYFKKDYVLISNIYEKK